jgi:DNA-binding MarR family transcriptional regulator
VAAGAAFVKLVSIRYHPAVAKDAPPAAARLLESIACIARLAQGELRARATEIGLQLVHLQALAYLARANRYSNTAVALTDFLGTSKGTVSQSLRLLEDAGLIRREADEMDRRVVRLALTARGRKALDSLTFARQWDAAVAALPAGEAAAADEALTGALRAVQRSGGTLTFGVCRSCDHFRIEGAAAFRCGLTGEPLSVQDSTLICREHRIATLGELRARLRSRGR